MKMNKFHLVFWMLAIVIATSANSCTDGKQEISGGTTNTIEVDNVEIEMWQVNGIIYVREDRGIQGVDCIAIDSSTLYPDVPSIPETPLYPETPE